jgi:hypothetical protein
MGFVTSSKIAASLRDGKKFKKKKMLISVLKNENGQ